MKILALYSTRKGFEIHRQFEGYSKRLSRVNQKTSLDRSRVKHEIKWGDRKSRVRQMYIRQSFSLVYCSENNVCPRTITQITRIL